MPEDYFEGASQRLANTLREYFREEYRRLTETDPIKGPLGVYALKACGIALRANQECMKVLREAIDENPSIKPTLIELSREYSPFYRELNHKIRGTMMKIIESNTTLSEEDIKEAYTLLETQDPEEPDNFEF